MLNAQRCRRERGKRRSVPIGMPAKKRTGFLVPGKKDLKQVTEGPPRGPIRCTVRRVTKPLEARDHKLCDGTGWLCEQHPRLAFGHDDCAGPGIPCTCNPLGEAEWKEIHAGGDDRDHIDD